MNKISKTIIGIALSVAVVAPVSGAVAYKAMTTDASAETTASNGIYHPGWCSPVCQLVPSSTDYSQTYVYPLKQLGF